MKDIHLEIITLRLISFTWGLCYLIIFPNAWLILLYIKNPEFQVSLNFPQTWHYRCSNSHLVKQNALNILQTLELLCWPQAAKSSFGFSWFFTACFVLFICSNMETGLLFPVVHQIMILTQKLSQQLIKFRIDWFWLRTGKTKCIWLKSMGKSLAASM